MAFWKICNIVYFDSNIMFMRRSLDHLISDLNWRSAYDHHRAKDELEMIALNQIEYCRSDEKLFNKLCHFFRPEWLGIYGELDGASYVERAIGIINTCKLLYVSERPESTVNYEFAPPKD